MSPKKRYLQQNQFDLTTRPLKKFAIPPSLHTVCLVEDQHKSKGFKTCANARFDEVEGSSVYLLLYLNFISCPHCYMSNYVK